MYVYQPHRSSPQSIATIESWWNDLIPRDIGKKVTKTLKNMNKREKNSCVISE